MPLEPGSRLGAYEIKSALGAGGMGEVYCARDTKLNRDVAIKVLPDLFAGDPERLGRLQREAQLLASLNHPHIAQIYGFEDSPSSGPGRPALRALVMEMVDGPTLADRIAAGPVPLDEALPIARQIAEALEAAHERGIIHRDLKPANIKLTAAGDVKVLDFGLAKALGPLAAHLGPAAMSAPTFANPETMSGVVLGTAAYMAPEQARGLAVDERADIWALGVVIYEMLAGHRPFEGETSSDTIAAVLRQDIHWAQLPHGTPDELRRLLRRCLQRDSKNRLHHAGDARLIIADVEDDRRAGRAGRSWRTRTRTLTPWLLAGVLIVAAAFAGVRGILIRSPDTVPAQQIVRFAIEPPPEVTNVSSVAVSADGRFAVYEAQVEGEFRFFMRRFDALDFPIFLHDGRTLALVRARQLVVRSWRDNSGRFEVGPERPVAPLAFGSGWAYGAPYDVASDGRFLALVRTEQSPPPRIRVMLGWEPEMVRPGPRIRQ